MQEICFYYIEVQGQVDEKELNAISPLEIKIKSTGTISTLIMVRTDQSGLVGLLRHLHGLGFEFLSVQRKY